MNASELAWVEIELTNIPGKTSEFGLVEFDVTHLKDQIKMYTPSDTEEGSERFEVTLRIRMTVIDRHMEFAAY
jgi:hypothetical protein